MIYIIFIYLLKIKAMAKKQQNIRMNADTKAILEIICEKRDHSQAQVIEEALKNEAKKEKITKKEIEDYKNQNPI